MKKTALILLITCSALQLTANTAYKIHLKMPDVKDTMVYLAHYYGQSGTKVYVADSAKMIKGNAVFESNNPDFVGGIYIILVAHQNFEILLNKGDDFIVMAGKGDLPDGITFKNSPENDRFIKYKEFTQKYASGQKQLESEIKEAKTAADTDVIRKKSVVLTKERIKYMQDYVHNNGGTLLANIFNAMYIPEIPEGTHFLEDGITRDSAFAYKFYKAHYWDSFNFKDDRLIYTPIYDSKIEEYISKLTLPWPDSMEKECDMLLGKAKGTKDMFHYTLYWLTHYVEESKIMGMDEVFVYLVENYYMKGDAFWLSNEDLQKYIKRAMDIAPNVIGNVAPEIKRPNIFTGKEESLNTIKAKYTVIVFYQPNCGHCQHELPLLDSVYEAVLKDKSVKVLTIATEGTDKQITDFLTKLKVDKEWINTEDTAHVTDCRNKYDVYSTPTIYLVDEKKIIRGKRLDHTNISAIIDMLEKKRLPKS
jgi:thiol-disulfide isomerase/thioredoxin